MTRRINREPLNPSSPFAVVVNDDPTQLNVLTGPGLARIPCLFHLFMSGYTVGVRKII